MNVCDLTTGVGRIKRAAALLKEKWLETKEHWDDQARADFEEAFMNEIPTQVTLNIAAIYNYAKVLDQAEKECADPDRPTYY